MPMQDMKISLFSQSLFALPLDEAIKTTAEIGFPAIELACAKTHFDPETRDPQKVAEDIRKAGLKVSALSMFNNFTDKARLDNQIRLAEKYIRMAPLFQTAVLKMTPGSPASADAKEEHWQSIGIALERLSPVAEEVGVRIAFETHMRQLTDTLAGTRRFLDMAKSDAIGLTVDFSNFSFAGEDMREVFPAVKGRMYNTHLKNGTVGENGEWHFNALDDGLTYYMKLFPLLRDSGYDGYLTIECLSPDSQKKPAETAKRDLEILKHYLEQTGYKL